MKYTASVLLASAGLATALIQQCSSREAVDEGGNWFCGAVDQILYEGIQGKGSFKAVTEMSDAGECLQKDQSYGGPLAPLDQDVSPITSLLTCLKDPAHKLHSRATL